MRRDAALGCAGRAGVGQAGGVEAVEGGHHPRLPEVEGVVGRDRAAVEARLRQVGGEGTRRAEPWVARQRLARTGEGDLEVADGQIGLGEARRDRRQHR